MKSKKEEIYFQPSQLFFNLNEEISKDESFKSIQNPIIIEKISSKKAEIQKNFDKVDYKMEMAQRVAKLDLSREDFRRKTCELFIDKCENSARNFDGKLSKNKTVFLLSPSTTKVSQNPIIQKKLFQKTSKNKIQKKNVIEKKKILLKDVPQQTISDQKILKKKFVPKISGLTKSSQKKIENEKLQQRKVIPKNISSQRSIQGFKRSFCQEIPPKTSSSQRFNYKESLLQDEVSNKKISKVSKSTTKMKNFLKKEIPKQDLISLILQDTTDDVTCDDNVTRNDDVTPDDDVTLADYKARRRRIFNQSELEVILRKLTEIENEEDEIRMRWKRIDLGLLSDRKENKLLITENQHSFAPCEIEIKKSPRSSPKKSFLTKMVKHDLDLKPDLLKSILDGAENFKSFLKSTHHQKKGNFDPCLVVEELADDVIDSMMMSVLDEVTSTLDNLIDHVIIEEFADPGSSSFPHLHKTISDSKCLKSHSTPRESKSSLRDEKRSFMSETEEFSNFENILKKPFEAEKSSKVDESSDFWETEKENSENWSVLESSFEVESSSTTTR